MNMARYQTMLQKAIRLAQTVRPYLANFCDTGSPQ